MSDLQRALAEQRKAAEAWLMENERGEWGSPDATSAGPPIEPITRHIGAYTTTNLVLLREAINREIEKRAANVR